MSLPSSICVYCASSADVAQHYKDAAVELGRIAAERGIDIVYGGGRVGLMGLLADAALAAGGKVTGIIPGHIVDMEVAHQTLTELLVVGTMHERKKMMFDRSEAFVILPGGTGTLDEMLEILTWRQLGLHRKPIVLVNIGGYWDRLLGVLRHGVDEGFIRPQHAGLMHEVADVTGIFAALSQAGAVDAAHSFT
jgi:uncharacterized protein (TIGR00730 family)